MRYVGGKARIADWIKREVIARRKYEEFYLEPFLGSAATFSVIAPYFKSAIATDLHVDLILMWQAIASGWVPPDHVSESEYLELKTSAPSALRGFAGFGAAFGGAWFHGYARGGERNYAIESKRWLMARAHIMAEAHIEGRDYNWHDPGISTVVYCDPPYADTTGYQTSNFFDSAKFWRDVERWANNGAQVFVSEEKAPPPWRCIAEKERAAALRKRHGSQRRVERLFTI